MSPGDRSPQHQMFAKNFAEVREVSSNSPCAAAGIRGYGITNPYEMLPGKVPWRTECLRPAKKQFRACLEFLLSMRFELVPFVRVRKN